VAKFVRRCVVVCLSIAALAFAATARAECGGGVNCVAVSFGDSRPSHGTPFVSAPLAFGEQAAGTASATRTVRVGAVTGPVGTRATLTGIELLGANASDFTITAMSCTTGSPSLLHDGAVQAQLANTCTIQLAFRPATAGAKGANLQVRTAAITRTVPLTGTGTASGAGPVAGPASLQVQVNTPATIDLAPFITGTATGITLVAAPQHGAVVVEGTRATYTPAPDYFGPDSFTYSAFNSAGSSPPALVSVNVGGRPDPSRNADVAGLLAAQSQAARRFASAQVANVQQRLEGRRGADRSGGPWLAGGIGLGHHDERGDRSRSRFTADGMTVGMDHRVSPQWLLGAGLGFAQEESEVGLSGSRSRSRGHSAAVYGSWQSGDAFVDGLLGYGQLRHDSDRFVAGAGEFAHVRGRKSRQVFGSVTGGYHLQRDGLLVSPYARLDAATDRFDPATEEGAGAHALTYFGQTQRNAQFAAGLRVESRHATRFGVAAPRLRLELRHGSESGREARVGYADQGGGTTYALSPLDAHRTSVLLGVGSDFAFRNGLTLGLDYTMERATGGARGYGMRAFLRQEFDAARAGSAPAAWRPSKHPVQVEAAVLWDDNVSRASEAADRRSDRFHSLALSRSATAPVADHVQAVLSAFVEGDKTHTHDGLDRLGLGARAELQYRPSAAYTAPTFSVFARGVHDDYHSSLRSGQRLDYGLSWRQSWTDRVDAFAALTRNQRHARSDVFDTRDWSARFNLDYSLGNAGVLYAGAEYRRGDTVTSSSAGEHYYEGFTRAQAPDDAFAGLTAFRVRARTMIWTLGWHLPLGARDSLELSWRHARSSAMAPDAGDHDHATAPAPRYRANQLSLAYLLRF
jgi:hypothetical protein